MTDNPQPADVTDFGPFAGEFARHWSPETAQYVWSGDDDAPDMNIWVYSHAHREPGPSWSVVVQQEPPEILGHAEAPMRTWGIRFSCSSLPDEILDYEMTPGIDEDDVAYVHPNAPRRPFEELPQLAQSRVWAEACAGWINADGKRMDFDSDRRRWQIV